MARIRVNSAELRRILIERKLSISEAAKQSEIPFSTLCKLTHYDGIITIKTCAKLVKAFGDSVVIEDFFTAQDFFKFAKQAGFELVNVHTVAETPEDYQILTFRREDAEVRACDGGEIAPPF